MSRKQGPLNPAKRKAKRSMRQKPLLPVLGRKRGPRDEAEALGAAEAVRQRNAR